MNKVSMELHDQLSLFKDIDVNQVHHYVGEGRNHLVFRYKKDWVLKIPKPGVSYSNSQTLQTDLELLKKYFPELMVPTTVLSSIHNSQYAILQEYCKDSDEVVGEVHSSVRSQLEKIIFQNKKLFRKTGKSLDLFGSSGFISSLLALLVPWCKPRLANLLLKNNGENQKLFLVDTELLRLSEVTKTWQSIRLHFRSWVSYHLTSFLLRRAFNFTSA